MRYYQNYGGAIWTNHALDRLVQRGLTQDMAYQAFQYPEKSLQGREYGTFEYVRYFDNHKVTVIAKQNEGGEWIILSCWVDPPYAGSIDIVRKHRYEVYKRSGIFKRVLLRILDALGIYRLNM